MKEKPYIVCHMMTSVDGRIDCAMTEHLPGVSEYYDTLDELDAPTRVSGRTTAELEMADPGKFSNDEYRPLGKEAFSRAVQADGYEVIADSHGSLLWDNYRGDRPLLILLSESVSLSYLTYLDSLHISWIATGKDSIDLVRATEILGKEFSVRRMAIVGGGHINAGFLRAGLLDEVSILIGAGIDGRGGMAAVFDGLPADTPVTPLHLSEVKTYDSGAVWLRYSVVPERG